ncbi:MAG: ferritin-like domain-containing protein [Myxococcales bacterium]|nr:ferritin-like domain-containing protein [Myxococcales bacterium]
MGASASEAFARESHDPALVERARGVWAERVHTEHRSAQALARYVHELLAVDAPRPEIEAALDMVRDELRHVALCEDVVRALGGQPGRPTPLDLPAPEAFRRAPAAQRAMGTAISMLVVNETLSVGYLDDLARRAGDGVCGHVVRAILGDEAGHGAGDVPLVERTLAACSPAERAEWAAFTEACVRPHLRRAEDALAGVPPAERVLEDEPAHAALGLFTPRRQALVLARTWRETLRPRLVALGLWAAAVP